MNALCIVKYISHVGIAVRVREGILDINMNIITYSVIFGG